ncbi:MFS transporter [Desulfobacca acetoxidans]|uniref:Major facilitator superfamily MFS_1 n=1 Tax=Desulfobacca acetoxidans (strain ATCC 700848 / DSM 11109 / ASRB2) TaxID=880072 RepID=F2NH48_DESAR|nr:MFS transporter [Desulfobacca acetoxidans]AEB08890.1 major facilitator superfamily MFS_1 [Desulfobacca acetoxidans DSM 11109]
MPTATKNPNPPASYKILLTVVCGIAFASYFATSLRLPVVPLFAVSLGASTSEVGFINSSFLLMCGLLALPLGLLGDRWGRKRIILLGLLIASSSSLLLYWSRTPLQIIWIYLAFGVGLAMIGPSLMAIVADISPATHLGRAYGWYTTSIYSAMSLGPAAGGLLAEALGYRQVFLFVAGAMFLLLIPVAWFLPRSNPRADDHQLPDLSQVISLGWSNHLLHGCWALTLGSCIALGVFFTFFPLYALRHGLNAGQIGVVFAAQAVINALSRIPLGRLSDQTDKTRLAIWGFLGLSLVLAAFSFSHSLTAFIVLAMASGAVQGVGFTPLGALIPEVVPVEARGLAMGGYNTAIYLGMMTGSAGMGPVIHLIGFEPSFFLAALINLFFTGWFYLAFRRKNGGRGRIPAH